MNYTLDSINTTSLLNNISSECYGSYVNYALGLLLFISEILPFLKDKSDCNKNETAPNDPEQLSNRTRRTSLMNNSNGLIHTGLSFYNKMKNNNNQL